jgi:hypothetical protein
MGGYGALRLGVKRADLFRGISAHSAIINVEDLSQFVHDPFPAKHIDATDGDLFTWVERNRYFLPPVTSSCSCKYGEGAGFPFQVESPED